jgi:hypothetical protein
MNVSEDLVSDSIPVPVEVEVEGSLELPFFSSLSINKIN